MKLRVDFRKDFNGMYKPVVVDAATGELLPEQMYCKISGEVEGLSKVTVTMWVDGDHVTMGKIGGTMQDENG